MEAHGLVAIGTVWLAHSVGIGAAAEWVVRPRSGTEMERAGEHLVLFYFVQLPPSDTLSHPLYQGAGTTLGWSIGQCAWMAVAIAGGCSIFTIAVIMPFLRKRLHLYLDE